MEKYVKLLMVTLFVTLSCVFTSCGGDDDDEPSMGNVVGTWKNTGGLSHDMGITIYLQFKDNGKCTEVDIDEDGIEVKKGSWEMEGNSLTMINHDQELGIDIPLTSKVEKLTKSELVIIALGFKEEYKRVSDSEIDKYLK